MAGTRIHIGDAGGLRWWGVVEADYYRFNKQDFVMEGPGSVQPSTLVARVGLSVQLYNDPVRPLK